jgi:acetamidase/formamidase
MRRLEATAQTVHFGFFDGSLAPIFEVESGEEFWINTVSAHPEHDVPREWIPKVIPEIFDRAIRGTGPHILTGPVAVKGARPGDVLQIDILDIKINQPYGYNNVYPARGMFGYEQPQQKTTIIPFDLEAGTALVADGISVPTAPFFGQLAVAPPRDWGRLDSRPPSRHGGNIDNKDLRPGTTLFLPVAVEGALFSAGDGHAAQGHGEINQTAIETGLDGRFRLTARRYFSINWPIACTPTHLMTMAMHEDLDDAARLAMREMIALLEKHYAMDFHDAYRLCSIAADMHVTQFVNGNRGIHVMLPRALVSGLKTQPNFLI